MKYSSKSSKSMTSSRSCKCERRGDVTKEKRTYEKASAASVPSVNFTHSAVEPNCEKDASASPSSLCDSSMATGVLAEAPASSLSPPPPLSASLPTISTQCNHGDITTKRNGNSALFLLQQHGKLLSVPKIYRNYSLQRSQLRLKARECCRSMRNCRLMSQSFVNMFTLNDERYAVYRLSELQEINRKMHSLLCALEDLEAIPLKQLMFLKGAAALLINRHRRLHEDSDFSCCMECDPVEKDSSIEMYSSSRGIHRETFLDLHVAMAWHKFLLLKYLKDRWWEIRRLFQNECLHETGRPGFIVKTLAALLDDRHLVVMAKTDSECS